MKKLNQTLLALAVIAAVVLLAIPPESVAAQAEGPQFKGDWTDKEPKEMDELYTDLVYRYDRAGRRIEKSEEAVSRLEKRIETLIEAGEDPAGLQAVLDAYLANRNTVQAAYEDLGAVVAEHAGFDADGQVTDEALAAVTLRQIADGLLDLRQLSEDSHFELRWDVRDYFYQNRN